MSAARTTAPLSLAGSVPGGGRPSRAARPSEAALRPGTGHRAPDPSAQIPLVAPAVRLTPREVQVLRLVAVGLTAPAIGRALGLSEHTVKSHISRMIIRTGAPNRASLVAFGVRTKVVPVPVVDVALDEREMFLVSMVAAARTYGEIAKALRLSESTAKRQVQGVMARVGAKDHAQLVAHAAGAGWRPRAGDV